MDKKYKADPASLDIRDIQGWRFLSEHFLKDRLRDKFLLDEQGHGRQIIRSSYVSIEGILTRYESGWDKYFYLQDDTFDTEVKNLSTIKKSPAIKVIIPDTYYLKGHKFIASLSKNENKYVLQVKGFVRENLYNFGKKRWKPIPGENGIQYYDPYLSQEGYDQYGHQVYSRTAETTIEASYIKVLGTVGECTYGDLSFPAPVDTRYIWLTNPGKQEISYENKEERLKNLKSDLMSETLSSYDSFRRLESIECNRVFLNPSIIIGRPTWLGKSEKVVSLVVEVIEEKRYEQFRELGLMNESNGVTLKNDSEINDLFRASILTVKIERLDKKLMEKITPGCLISKPLEGFIVRDFIGNMVFEVPKDKNKDVDVNATHFSPVIKNKNDLRGHETLLSIATLNLGNLSGTDFKRLIGKSEKEAECGAEEEAKDHVVDYERRGKVKKLAQQIDELGRPDIIACQELGDDDGEQVSLSASSKKTIKTFLSKINRNFDVEDKEAYEDIFSEPPPNTSGGKPGLNIRNGFFIKKALLNRIKNKDSKVINSGVDPSVCSEGNNPFLEARNPAFLSFDLEGEHFSIANVHLSSRLGESILNGECSSKPVLSAARGQQLQAILNFFDEEGVPDTANKIIFGDFNTYWYCPEMEILKESGWVNLIERCSLNDAEKYTYVHDGLASCLDHVFVGGGLVAQPGKVKSSNVTMPLPDLQILHLNSYTGKLSKNASPIGDYDQDKWDMRTVEATDHDPVLVQIIGQKKSRPVAPRKTTKK